MGELMPDLDGVEIQDERPWVWDQSVVVEGKAAAEREEEEEVLRTQNWRGSGGQNRLFREPVVLFRGVQRGAGPVPIWLSLSLTSGGVWRGAGLSWDPRKSANPPNAGRRPKRLTF
jgi:hypothetical protein